MILLIPMMTVKFLIVAGYFMHLKYDNHLFRRVFFFGLILAIVVFLIMLVDLRVLGRRASSSTSV